LVGDEAGLSELHAAIAMTVDAAHTASPTDEQVREKFTVVTLHLSVMPSCPPCGFFEPREEDGHGAVRARTAAGTLVETSDNQLRHRARIERGNVGATQCSENLCVNQILRSRDECSPVQPRCHDPVIRRNR
jgi:hypothetical protein